MRVTSIGVGALVVCLGVGCKGKDGAAADAGTSPPVNPLSVSTKDNPFPLASPSNAWFVLTWSMDATAAERALKGAGFADVSEGRGPTGFKGMVIVAKQADWSIQVNYVPGPDMKKIRVDRRDAPADVVKAMEAQLDKRFGAKGKVGRTVSHDWAQEAEGRVTGRLVINESVLVIESWRRGKRGPGPAGVMGLSWGAPVAQIRAALAKDGFDVKDEREELGDAGPDPMRRPALVAKKANVTVRLVFDERASSGLTSVTVDTTYADEGAGRARLAELERALGKPSGVRSSRNVSWTSEATDASLSVRDDASGRVMASETYSVHGAKEDDD
jgi:hypothetical protein